MARRRHIFEIFYPGGVENESFALDAVRAAGGCRVWQPKTSARVCVRFRQPFEFLILTSGESLSKEKYDQLRLAMEYFGGE